MTNNIIPWRCTFTGVDEFSSLEHIEEISLKFPFVEWGVLLSTSENRQLNGFRYPSLDWLHTNLPKLSKISQKSGCSIALHVCGKETKNLLNNIEDNIALQPQPYVQRIQINFRYKPKDISLLESLCYSHPSTIFITQHNQANIDLYSKINLPNHQILFDTSGGQGIKSSSWPNLLPNKICGYAGGLGLVDIEKDFSEIFQLANHQFFWIDMEGKIRTDDKLDLNICEQILAQIQRFQ